MTIKEVGTRVHIHWLTLRDTPDVLSIEAASFEFPWSEDTLIRTLRKRNTNGMVAEIADKVVGVMIYELHKNRLHLINFAVAPTARRQGVGSAMVEKMVSKLSYDRRNRITLEVRETNLAAQLFFKSQGFRAVRVLKDFYEDVDEDAYLMQYRHVGD